MASPQHALEESPDSWLGGRNDEIDSWFFMENPMLMLGVLGVYFLFIFKLGPHLMKDRQPMELRKTMIIYNGAQVIYSVYLVYLGLQKGSPLWSVISSKCPTDEKRSVYMKLVANAFWWYLMGKLTELLDTIFLILRKRTRQISFLHVYHHAHMVFCSWFMLKYFLGEQVVMFSLNSLVHTIMYTYYLIAALGPKYKKYIWWKKYMTIIQIIQFCLIMSFVLYLTFSDCGYYRPLSYFMFFDTLAILILFGNFYRKSYGKKSDRSSINNVEAKDNDVNHDNIINDKIKKK